MRKSAILATVALLALAGCGKGAADKASADQATAAASQVQTQSSAVAVQDIISEQDKLLVMQYATCMLALTNYAHANLSVFNKNRLNGEPTATVGAMYIDHMVDAVYWGYSLKVVIEKYKDNAGRVLQWGNTGAAKLMATIKVEDYDEFISQNCKEDDIPMSTVEYLRDQTKLSEFAEQVLNLPPLPK